MTATNRSHLFSAYDAARCLARVSAWDGTAWASSQGLAAVATSHVLAARR